MNGALEDHVGTISIGGRSIINLQFVGVIGGLAGSEHDLANVVRRMDETSTRYGMEISAEKTNLMASNDMPITSDIAVDGLKRETSAVQVLWSHDK